MHLRQRNIIDLRLVKLKFIQSFGLEAKKCTGKLLSSTDTRLTKCAIQWSKEWQSSEKKCFLKLVYNHLFGVKKTPEKPNSYFYVTLQHQLLNEFYEFNLCIFSCYVTSLKIDLMNTLILFWCLIDSSLVFITLPVPDTTFLIARVSAWLQIYKSQTEG